MQVALLPFGALLVPPLSSFLSLEKTPFSCYSKSTLWTDNTDTTQGPQSRPTKSESALEQDPQGILVHTKV